MGYILYSIIYGLYTTQYQEKFGLKKSKYKSVKNWKTCYFGFNNKGLGFFRDSSNDCSLN